MKTAMRLFIVMLTFLPWLTACGNDTHIPKPPLSVPFEVQKEGSKVETTLRVLERREYLFDLRLMYKEKNPKDHVRVGKLTGGAGIDKNGKPVAPGVPILLRLKIDVIDDSGMTPMLDQEIAELRRTAHTADFFGKQIATVLLKPGRYRISVESLKDVPELVGTPVVLHIGRPATADLLASLGSIGSLLGYFWSRVLDYVP